jgi:hypothetical protein
VVEVLADTTLIPPEVALFHVLGEKSGLTPYMFYALREGEFGQRLGVQSGVLREHREVDG